MWWFEWWYSWRIRYLLSNQFRLALVKERRCQAAGEALGCTWGLSPCRARESLELLLPSRLASALCWEWGWQELSAFCVVSVLSLTAVLCPSALRSLARGSSGGDQRWATACACVGWRRAHPSSTSSVSLLKRELQDLENKCTSRFVDLVISICADLEMQILQGARETFPRSLPACWPQAFGICSVMELLVSWLYHVCRKIRTLTNHIIVCRATVYEWSQDMKCVCAVMEIWVEWFIYSGFTLGSM